MKPDATETDVERVLETIEKLGFKPHEMPGANRIAIGITGNPGAVDPTHFENLSGVADAIRVTKPYKLISKSVYSPRACALRPVAPKPSRLGSRCAIYEMSPAPLSPDRELRFFRN